MSLTFRRRILSTGRIDRPTGAGRPIAGAPAMTLYGAAGEQAIGRQPVRAGAARLRAASRSTPPTLLALLSMLAVQVGAADAKGLFHRLGTGGTVFMRIWFAAIVLLVLWRPRIRGHSRRDYTAVLLFGITIAAMNASFYAAIARLPLGIAVTVEFLGPLGLAIAGSRHRLDLLWAGLALLGIALLTPIRGEAIDPIGLLFAVLAGALWAVYILANIRVGAAFPGHDGLALSMAVAAVAIAPAGVALSAAPLLNLGLLAAGASVALLSTVIPFSLEHAALKRLPARTFGVLMSLEPGIAALIGLLVLGEALSLRTILALACVTLATVGNARWGSTG